MRTRGRSWAWLAMACSLAVPGAGCKRPRGAEAAPPPVVTPALPEPARPAVSELPHPILLQRMHYPLAACAVDGRPLPAEPADWVHEERLIRLCGAPCREKAQKDPAAAWATVEAAHRAAQRPEYPRTSCVVCLDKLGSTGPTQEVLHELRLAILCGAPCLAVFRREPRRYVERIEKDLIDRKLPDFPFNICIVSHKALVHSETDRTDPVDFLWGPHLVRVCCPTCQEKFLRTFSWEEKLRLLAAIERERERKKERRKQ